MKFSGNRERAARSRGFGEAGNALIEFALAVPILMILVLVAADYALLVNDTMNLRAATRGAAEYAKTHTTASGTTVATYGNFAAGVTPTVSTVCTCTNNSSVTCPAVGATTNPCSGVADSRVVEYAQVSATQPFTPWFSYAGYVFPASLSASTSLRIQ